MLIFFHTDLTDEERQDIRDFIVETAIEDAHEAEVQELLEEMNDETEAEDPNIPAR